MKIHYFQRYHEKENVATANTMLLLSRFYSYSTDKFFRFLKKLCFHENFEPELIFELQPKSKDSVPDAMVSQHSFKIVVETKRSSSSFNDRQLLNHLSSFKNENYKVLLTLAPEPMLEKDKIRFEQKLDEYKKNNNLLVAHKNTTFEEIANAIGEELNDQDYEMQEVLEDFMEYCYEDELIPRYDSWKYMRVQLAGKTFDFNINENVYYDNADRGFRAHDILGLYTNKSVRAIGKIVSIITAIQNGDSLEYNAELGDLTEERKKTIQNAIIDGDSHGYDLRTARHRYFFVEKFYETDFKKVSARAPWGTRVFDLSKILEIDEASKMPKTEELSDILKTKIWE